MDPDLTIVLLGNSGTGKSASGNTILGQRKFVSKCSFKSVTKEISAEEEEVFGKRISVIDTPGILCPGAKEKIASRCEEVVSTSRPCLFLVVIKMDRFTAEERKAVDTAIDVLKGKEEWSYLLFTCGDKLSSSLDEFIYDDDENSLPDIIEIFSGRYHLFNNEDGGHEQVRELLQKSGHLHRRESEESKRRTIMLFGLPGGGKSATGNTILGSKKFKSDCDFNPVTTEFVSESAEVEGRQVTVVDTLGFTDEVLTLHRLREEILKTVENARPGPHALVFVIRIGRISTDDVKLFRFLLELFGGDASKYAMVIFTHGDYLRGRSIDDMIQSLAYVSDLVRMCGGRYCVFDNTKVGNRQQVKDFLGKIDEMVTANGGEHCNPSLFSFKTYHQITMERMRERFMSNWQKFLDLFR